MVILINVTEAARALRTTKQNAVQLLQKRAKWRAGDAYALNIELNPQAHGYALHELLTIHPRRKLPQNRHVKAILRLSQESQTPFLAIKAIIEAKTGMPLEHIPARQFKALVKRLSDALTP